MIPLNDTEPHHYSELHFMTLVLIGANCLMCLGEVFGNFKSPQELFCIMGAYLLLFPGGKIRTLVLLVVVPV